MERLSCWEARLGGLLEARGQEPHAYGRNDCMIFAAAAVEAVTGLDLAKAHRGKYRSAAGASRYLRSLGHDTPADMVTVHLPEQPVAMAQRGDIVADADGVPGVCIGAKVAFVGLEGSRAGLVTKPLLECSRAWRVGHE